MRLGRVSATLTLMASRAMSSLAGADPTQATLMRERVVLVTPRDEVVGAASKHAAHLVSTGLPLHRAFSVFLFDTKNRLLVQQRAQAKITYPRYWANACCSHPLYCPRELGMGKSEDPDDSIGVIGGERAVAGVKSAAIRKLWHELGIAPGTLSHKDLKMITRVHYRDVYGKGVWGEHELDYILFVQKDVELHPRPNEVSAVRWCTQWELKDMFAPPKFLSGEADSDYSQNKYGTVRVGHDSPEGFLISPWFRYIMDAFGWTWWNQLVEVGPKGVTALSDDSIHVFGECQKVCDYEFQPTSEHPE